MRKQFVFHDLGRLEALDLRLSLSSVTPGVSPATPLVRYAASGEDPIPNPEPSPGPTPQDPQPTDPYPGLPPSGPAGPGSS